MASESMIERVDERLLECVADGDRASDGFVRSIAQELLAARRVVEKEPPRWLVFQRVNRTCFVMNVASMFRRDPPSNGERVIAVSYHETDAEYIVATVNDAILSESPTPGDGT